MKIKDIKEKYRNYKGEHCGFSVFSIGQDKSMPSEKYVVVVEINRDPYIGDYVLQVVRVRDGKEMLPNGASRPCDNLADAVDVACEMEWIEEM